MKKYVILAITLGAFITLLVGCGTKEDFRLQNVNSIVLQDNTTEGSVTIVDKDTISTFVNNFNKLSIKKENSFISPASKGFSIIFKDANGNTIEDMDIFSKTSIYNSNSWYEITKGSIDLDLIKTQLEK